MHTQIGYNSVDNVQDDLKSTAFLFTDHFQCDFCIFKLND